MFFTNILVIWVTFVPALSFTIGGDANSGTACSKFHFEEKVLEKLVRLEHKIEIFEQKQKAWEEKIESKSDQLKQEKTQRTQDFEKAIDTLSRQSERQISILIDGLEKREKAVDANIGYKMDRLETEEVNRSKSTVTLLDTVNTEVQSQVKILQDVATNVTSELSTLSRDLELKYDKDMKALDAKISAKLEEMNKSEINRTKAIQSLTNSTQFLGDYQKTLSRKIEDIHKSTNTVVSLRKEQNDKVAVTACMKDGSYQVGSNIIFTTSPVTKGISSYGITSLGNGKFVCERPGLYLITAFIMTNKDSSYVSLFKNNNALAFTIGGDASSGTSCSKFHFEEKVLEKLVRLEHKIEIFEQKQKAWEDNIGSIIDKLEKAEKQRTQDVEITIDTISRELERQKNILIDGLEKREKTFNANIGYTMDTLDAAEVNRSKSTAALIDKVNKVVQSQVWILQDVATNVTSEMSTLSRDLEFEYASNIKALDAKISAKLEEIDKSEINRTKAIQSLTNSTQQVLGDYQKTLSRKIEDIQNSTNNTVVSFRKEQNDKVAVTACAKDGTYQAGSNILFTTIHVTKGISSYGITSLGNGKFVCERSGLYLITSFILTDEDSSNVSLYKNNVVIAYNYYTMHHHYQTHSVSVLEQLNVNDTVYILTDYSMYIYGGRQSCMSILQITD